VFHASPAVNPDRALLRVNLTKLPIWSESVLRDTILTNFARYGIVREFVLYLDDWSNSWFTGNGHLYIERPTGKDIRSFESLTYQIPLEGKNTFCLATWTKMDAHCIYCKSMGHSRKDCDKLPVETRSCYVCHNRGHIARNCPKARADNTTSSKRRRNAELSAFIPTASPIQVAASSDKPKAHSSRIESKGDSMQPQTSEPNSGSLTDISADPNANSTKEPQLIASSNITEGVEIQDGAKTPQVQLLKLHTMNTRTKNTSDEVLDQASNLESSNKQFKSCKCGSTAHKRPNHSTCPLNKKNINQLQTSHPGDDDMEVDERESAGKSALDSDTDEEDSEIGQNSA
jgi:hypothetical protein